MSIKSMLIALAVLVLVGMFGVVINPDYNISDVTLLNVFVFCLIVGIPLFLLTNRYWIIHLIQRGKRQDLLNRYGFYETVETQTGKLIGDDMLGGVSTLISSYTTFHLHTKVDCPFLIKPDSEDVSEYSCQLLLKGHSYNMTLEEIIKLLENPYINRQDTFFLSSHSHCKCMEWTGHITF